MFFQKMRKLTIGFLLSILIFSSVAGFLVSAQPANAQLAVLVTGDIQAQANSIVDMIKNGWKIAVLNAAQQAVSYFLRKLAYDSAVWLASGGKGQSPYAQTKGFGDYMASVGSDAAGTAIEQLGKGFGLDLCKIPDVQIDLALRIGLHYNYNLDGGNSPAAPACNLATFQENWSGNAWATKYGDGQGGFDVNKVFNKTLTVEDAPLGIALKTTQKIDRLVLAQTNAAQADRLEGQGYKAATRLISGETMIPSQTIKKEAEANTPSEQTKKSEAQIAAAMGSGAWEIIPSTLSLFLNTLSGQMLKNFKDNGMLPGGLCVGGYGDPSCKTKSGSSAQNFVADTSVSGRAVAEAAFSEFLITKLDALSNYDILRELNSCESRGLYNCRADSYLVQAIQEEKQSAPVTVKEAMNKGWLHRSWKLIPPSRTVDNSSAQCYNSAYCYSNIQVLRQLRILPLGFEIAAKNSDPDSPWTLEDVVNGFYDCNYNKDAKGNIVGITYDPVNKPFCHLIDPNWVIKLSQARCDAEAYSGVPLNAGVPNRVKECVDVKTCVGYDKEGNCASFGNCVREKNVWKFDATKCDAQYTTCRAFTDSVGKDVSYLYRTLDTGDCNQDTAGCTAYSLEQDDKGWKEVSKTDYGSYSTGIYLNKNVSTANVCNADAVGCSAFKLSNDANSNNIIPLKKAPNYLNCYDANLNTKEIEWPKTFSDIFQMQPSPECKNFAQVCIADEVGCANFKLIDDSESTPIPGKFTPALEGPNRSIVSWNDQCDEKCSGYAAYREMPSTYSSGTPLAYIVPPSVHNQNQSGTKCTVAQDGCSSFTNMSASSAGGGEKVEYFTDLRVCIKPDTNKQKNFYTYEGSVTGGYQLQVYILEKDEVTGNPKTVYLTSEEKSAADAVCNSNQYKAGLADPDCRQFNDEKGVISYALLKNTVVVSDACAPYRLNSAEFASEGKCFGNGEYRDGACYYNGLPTNVVTNVGYSKTCTADAVSCRGYKGNNGNNIRTVRLNNESSTETFENQSSVTAVNNWSSVAGSINWSPESTIAGQHSLGFVGVGNDSVVKKSVNLQFDNLDLGNNMSYSLSFWAKGSSANLGVLNVNIAMTDGKNNTVPAGTITANTSWQYFTFNFVELQSSGTSSINFILKNAGNLYLDNIRLTKVVDFLYLVKDSLKVDPVCDDNQTDNLPGVALGCSAYSGPANTAGTNDPYFLTNFSFLCREGAIGCTAFIDTYNKIGDSGPRAYNVSLSGISGTKVTANIGTDSYSCQIEQGKTSCYTGVIKGYTKAEIEKATGAVATFGASTYFIPADTSSTAPIYLVPQTEQANFACNIANLGCTSAGLQRSTPTGNQFETTTIKLDPQAFESVGGTPGILCHKEALGCGIYGSSQGEAYFKDPAVTGAKICTYQIGVIKDNNKVDGWFWKGVGVCGNTTTLKVDVSKATCISDSDCSVGSGCIEKDIQPCYPNYLQNGNNYGLWSFGNKGKYENFVGECPAAQDACTEFVDRNDNDKAYYFLKNNKISQGDCSGMVSQKAGCVLFDQTDNPNKFWNTSATYLLSDSYVPGRNSDLSSVTKVQPVNQKEKNDTNIIIKVTRDRECSEWLQCRQSHPVWDAQKLEWKQVCEKVGRCNRLPANAQEDNPTNCAVFIDNQHSDSNQLLSENLYTSRNITWKGSDYSGYSILGMYPVEELGQYNIGENSVNAMWRLAKPVVCGKGTNCSTDSLNTYSCIKDKESCGAKNEGVCINGTCLSDPFGGKDLGEKAPKYDCRAYPEVDSPFPNLSVTTKERFGGVNKCSVVEGDSAPDDQARQCECQYSKVGFGNSVVTKYYDYNDSAKSKGSVCVGGSNNGKECEGDLSCPNGACQKSDKVTKFLGWWGQCLEPDLSRTANGQKDEYPCLSWLPVDKLQGTIDINDQNPKAMGVMGTIGSEGFNYCLNATKFYRAYKIIPYFDYSPSGCFGACHSDNDYLFACNSAFPNEPNFEDYKVAPDAAEFGECNEVNENYSTCSGKACYKEATKNDWLLNTTGQRIWATTVGCLVSANIKSTDVAFTDNIWKDKKGFILDTTSTDFQYSKTPDRSNFTYMSPKDPFARLTATENPETDLIGLMYCKAGNNLTQPLAADGNCIGADPQGTVKNLTYGQWVSDFKCATNKDCNKDITCDLTGVTSAIQCKVNCRNDADCIFHYKEFAGPPNENLGSCIKPLGSSTGVCSKPASNSACIKHPVTDPDISESTECAWQEGFFGDGSHFSKGERGVCMNLPLSFGKCTNDPNKECALDDACYTQVCDGNDCVNPGQGSGNANTLVTKLASAFEQFQQLFARINIANINIFSTTTQNYVSLLPDFKQTIENSNKVKLDLTEGGIPPVVHPVGACNTEDKCIELPQAGISVNGISDKNVRITALPNAATIQFFGSADKNQMPLKQIVVDWGDGRPGSLYGDPVNGSFSNQRGALVPNVCVNSKCGFSSNPTANSPIVSVSSNLGCNAIADCKNQTIDVCRPAGEATDFGSILNETCGDRPFTFSSTYDCVANTNINPYFHPACTDDTKVPTDFPNGCCVYQPKVQILDNWGLCNNNGSCPDQKNQNGVVVSAGGNKCYTNISDPNNIIDECTSEFGLTANTPFKYKVLVAPNKNSNSVQPIQ
ncbi:MAG: hypothetical protein WCV83_01010 [Candidatus Magasanikbacteria bacterium]